MEPKKAVALQYEKNQDLAPRVVAKGAGEVAEAIIRIAQSADVTVYENQALANALMQLEIDHVIPPDLYAVVAEVLAFVYRTSNAKGLTGNADT